MANSSPPTRATVSWRRTVSTRRWLTCRMRSSPAAWPRVSLTVLKWSRSTKNMQTGSPTRRDRTSSCSTRSSKSRRLGSPVSASCQAMCETFSSSSRFCRAVAAWSARPDSRSWRSRVVGGAVGAVGRSWRRPHRGSRRLAKSGATTDAAVPDRSSRARRNGSSVDGSRTMTSRSLDHGRSTSMSVRTLQWLRRARAGQDAPGASGPPVPVTPAVGACPLRAANGRHPPWTGRAGIGHDRSRWRRARPCRRSWPGAPAGRFGRPTGTRWPGRNR